MSRHTGTRIRFGSAYTSGCRRKIPLTPRREITKTKPDPNPNTNCNLALGQVGCRHYSYLGLFVP